MSPAAGPGAATQVMSGRRTAETLQTGEEFGHYRIIRALGGGGMGTVFEAEDLETGRRVALKVLSQTLDSPDGRERFLREGRLAASINHPNSVYVFGTEEIGGTPVISMELVEGGTLEERVRARGPMPYSEAVDAVLQIIAGLEAAQKIGILHRDVKPSNCFIDAEGTVKIGDFGLSISTALRTEPALTTTGSFLGTPGFCSPEQLRGEELSVRSDIYSVGVTLYYLVTGRTPFEVKNVVALIATVLEQPAPSAAKLRPGLPQGLARVVQRCLAKLPAERCKDYEELRLALEPYSSSAPVPANLGLRFAAGVMDFLLLGLVGLVIVAVTSLDPFQLAGMMTRNPWQWLGIAVGGMCVWIFYFAVLEGFWGASVGKFICRLRVVGPEKSAPGFSRALLRAMMFELIPIVPFWLMFGWRWSAYFSQSNAWQMLSSATFYGLLALLFVTVRRRNGNAAVHDLATRTRVISRAALPQRPALTGQEAVPAGVEATPCVGPYHILQTLETSPGGSWLLGYDLRLLRKVWIRKSGPSTPPVSAEARHLARAGRLRWLSGRRSPQENWDAYEAPAGKPLLTLLAEGPQPWKQVRFWLWDLARELDSAQKDHTLPSGLGLDQVWITADGRAKLLDFPAPGLAGQVGANETAPPPLSPGGPQQFLKVVAAAALGAQNGESGNASAAPALPLPSHARDFLERLPKLPGLEAVAGAISPLLRRPAEVTRARRTALVAGCFFLPLLAIFAVMFGLRFVQAWETRYPGLMELNALLTDRHWSPAFSGRPGPSDQQYAIYIAAHYRGLITNADAWSNMMAMSLVKGDDRRFAEQSVREHPSPAAAEVSAADAVIGPRVPKTRFPELQQNPLFPLVILTGTLAFYVGIPAVIAAVAFRGGLLLLIAGVGYVRRTGERASRLRLLWRALVAWAAVWPAFGFAIYYMEKPLTWPGILFFAGVCTLVIVSLMLPRRSLPDRLAGTWPVPR